MNKTLKTEYGILNFVSDTHTYTLNGTEIKSVSHYKGGGGSGSEAMMKAAEQGTLLHYYLENLIKNNGVSDSPSVSPDNIEIIAKMKIIKKFYHEKIAGKKVMSEAMIVGKCGSNFYAGTIDVILQDDDISIIDLKTGAIPKSVSKTNAIQLRMYKKGFEDTYGFKSKKQYNVYLDVITGNYIMMLCVDKYDEAIEGIYSEIANGKNAEVIEEIKKLADLDNQAKELKIKYDAQKSIVIEKLGKQGIKTDYGTFSYVPASESEKVEFNSEKFKDDIIKMSPEFQMQALKLYDSCFEKIKTQRAEQYKFITKK